MLQLDHKERPFANDIISRIENLLGIKSVPKSGTEARTSSGRSGSDNGGGGEKFKFPEQTFDRKEIEQALSRGYSDGGPS
jgi:hypothetical protein